MSFETTSSRPPKRANCAVCGVSLAGKRAGSVTCSPTCRSALRRRRAAETGSTVRLPSLCAVQPRAEPSRSELILPPRSAWHHLSGPEFEEDDDFD